MNSTLAGITVEAGVNEEAEPFLTIIARNEDNQMFVGQLSPAELRREVLGWLSAVEAAEHDAAVLRVCRSLGVGEPGDGDLLAAAILQNLRVNRSYEP